MWEINIHAPKKLEDVGSLALWNASVHPPHYMLQPEN
jgi:hypothetical protein